jgi:nucleoporin POM152
VCAQLPFFTLLSAIGKVMLDNEIAVAERPVKISSLLFNSSLISGKQIINILPEGFVS